MRIVLKLILVIIFIIFFSLFYLSIFGIETSRFNNQISNKVTDINKDFKIELNKIQLVLDPFTFKLNIRTAGSKLKKKNQIIEIENIKATISLKSIINNKFSIKKLEIDTKSLEIKNLISFVRSINDTPQLFILEKLIKKGIVIGNIKLQFDDNGKIRKNFKINGYIKDVKLALLKKYNIEKLNLNFEYNKNELFFKDILFSLNKLNFYSDNLIVKNVKNEFLFNGNINHKKIDFNKKDLDLFVKPYISNLKIEKLNLSSKNIFSFKLTKKFQLKDFQIKSETLIDEFLITNNLNFKKIFPEIKDNISFSKNKIDIVYEKNRLNIKGAGLIRIQKNNDDISYEIKKDNQILNFKVLLKVIDNPIIINLLNYEKIKRTEALIDLEGIIEKNKQTLIKSFILTEEKNKFDIRDLIINKKLNVISFDKINLDYIDKEKQKNKVEIKKKNNEYHLKGISFNANNLIDEILKNDDGPNIINLNSKLNIEIKKIYLDSEYNLQNFSGYLSFKNQEMIEANLVGNFSNNKKLTFTVNTDNNNKITTLFLEKAAPIVKRYKFIKGFEEGSLDFYSSKRFDETISTLKIYDFKLKELPALTKILTLASLQGIADILSGEGIRFDEFEMNFKNNKNLMTINEIYAIGPAISILMDGYIEKDKIISLRGTLVPATTINKAIGSIPILGKILVGSKTGEGVFGVSFKIKGPPKNLETTVNPIKTLTPRFITRTLEKIKKN